MHMMKRKYVSHEHLDNNGRKVKENYFSNKLESKTKGNHVNILEKSKFIFNFIDFRKV